MYYFEKLARSDDAKRKKQYRQMLKRLYGGNDEMIDGVKENGPNIYHGTKKKHISNIKKEGFKVDKGVTGQYGKGVYFGDKRTALSYADGKEDAMLRLKRPSELKGSKIKYGNQSNFKKVTQEALPAQGLDTKNIPRKDAGDINHASKRYLELAMKHNKNNDDLAKNIANKAGKKMLPEELKNLSSEIDGLRNGGRPRKTQSFKMVKSIYKKRSDDQLNRKVEKTLGGKGNVEKVKAYGKINGINRLNIPQYNGNHILSTTDVDKRLITQDKRALNVKDGKALKVRKKTFNAMPEQATKPNLSPALSKPNLSPALSKPNLSPASTIKGSTGFNAKNTTSTLNKGVKKVNPKLLGGIGVGVGLAGAGYAAHKSRVKKKAQLEKKACYVDILLNEAML